MPTMIVRLRTSDFFDWQQVFQRTGHTRQSAGLSNERIYRGTRDGNDIVVVMQAADLDLARKYANSPLAAQIAEMSGVLGTPSVDFVEDGAPAPELRQQSDPSSLAPRAYALGAAAKG